LDLLRLQSLPVKLAGHVGWASDDFLLNAIPIPVPIAARATTMKPIVIAKILLRLVGFLFGAGAFKMTLAVSGNPGVTQVCGDIGPTGDLWLLALPQVPSSLPG
jgi:hypothetical protein